MSGENESIQSKAIEVAKSIASHIMSSEIRWTDGHVQIHERKVTVSFSIRPIAEHLDKYAKMVLGGLNK